MSTGFKPLARAIMPLQFRIYDNQSIMPWCEHTGIDVSYLLQCINEALIFWNEAMPGKDLILAPEFIFNWGSQPNLEWQIPNWIKPLKGNLWGQGNANQNISKYSNECVKGFIDFTGYDGPGIWTKPDGINNYEIPKEDVLKWIFKHELGHILGLWHVFGAEHQNNIMHSGNREIPLAVNTGGKDLQMLKLQYPDEFGLAPKYRKIYRKLYWKIN